MIGQTYTNIYTSERRQVCDLSLVDDRILVVTLDNGSRHAHGTRGMAGMARFADHWREDSQ